METSLIILLVVLALGGYLLYKITSAIIRVIIILVVIGVGYYLYQGGSLTDLKKDGVQKVVGVLKDDLILEIFHHQNWEKLTADCPDPNDHACSCILQPVASDLKNRLGEEEFMHLKSNPSARLDEIKKSILNQKKTIKDCLIRSGGQKYLDKFGNALDEVI